MPIPDELREKLALFRGSGRFYRQADEMFALTSWVQVMIGQRIVPQGYHPLVDAVSDTELAALGESVRSVVARCVAAMPTHEQFIDRYCRAPAAA
jgi:tryptophan halogenase